MSSPRLALVGLLPAVLATFVAARSAVAQLDPPRQLRPSVAPQSISQSPRAAAARPFYQTAPVASAAYPALAADTSLIPATGGVRPASFFRSEAATPDRRVGSDPLVDRPWPTKYSAATERTWQAQHAPAPLVARYSAARQEFAREELYLPEEIAPGAVGGLNHGSFDAGYGLGEHWHGLGYQPLWLENLTLFSGWTAFKGPVDRGRHGNFGFITGGNLAVPVSHGSGIGAQFGVAVAKSNFSRSIHDDSDRFQLFLTTGLFRRVECGWQGGVVFDWLHDEYYARMDLHQLRAEMSWHSGCGREIGALVAVGTSDDEFVQRVDVQTEVLHHWDITHHYTAFVRQQLGCGGYGRIFAGATNRKDGLIGSDLWVPLGPRLALRTAGVYLAPQQGRHDPVRPARTEESWGLSINLVWHPGCNASHCGPYRPLFHVADNTSVLVDRRLPNVP
jgi:hypothetical protein